jgi:hypothetical protein
MHKKITVHMDLAAKIVSKIINYDDGNNTVYR